MNYWQYFKYLMKTHKISHRAAGRRLGIDHGNFNRIISEKSRPPAYSRTVIGYIAKLGFTAEEGQTLLKLACEARVEHHTKKFWRKI